MGNGESKNGLAGFKDLNWPTVVLILATGVGNWWSTNQNGGANRQEIDANRAAIEKARQQVNEIYENQQRLPQHLEPAIETNAEHVRELTDRVGELEKRVDAGMDALRHIVGESKDAANEAADTSRETNETVKKNPPKQTTVIHRKIQRVQKVQKIQKIYKLF